MALFYTDNYPDWMDELMNDVYILFEDEDDIDFDKKVWERIRESEEPPHVGNASVIVLYEDLVRIMKRYFKDELDAATISEDEMESKFNFEANDMGSHFYFNDEGFTELDELKDMVEEWIKENDNE